MIAKIYLKGVIVVMTCLFNSQFETVHNRSNYTSLSEQLAMDFQEIFEFSEKMKLYGVTQKEIEIFFQKGIMESFNFHQSSRYIKQANLNRIIEKKFTHHQALKHPLKKPSKSNYKSLKGWDVLNTFSGKWRGKWKSISVRHLWLPFKESNLIVNKLSRIIGFQTCFIGDGFGWNYLVRTKDETLILGYVYHFDNNGKLISENPHYAFINDHRQLTWVSDNHVYYEFICDDNDCFGDRHYVINAIPYTTQKGKQKFDSLYQTVYRSENTFN